MGAATLEEARNWLAEYDLPVEHVCGRCGRKYECRIVAYRRPSVEENEHYDDHPQEALCDLCCGCPAPTGPYDHEHCAWCCERLAFGDGIPAQDPIYDRPDFYCSIECALRCVVSFGWGGLLVDSARPAIDVECIACGRLWAYRREMGGCSCGADLNISVRKGWMRIVK